MDILHKNLADHSELLSLIENDVNKVIYDNHTLFERKEI